jgi:hypothetical protein
MKTQKKSLQKVKQQEEIKPEEIKPVEENNITTDNEILTEKLKEVIASDINTNETIEPEKVERRGRPKKDKQAEKITPQIVIPIAPIIDIIVTRLPNPLPLTNMEKEYINEAGNKLAEKYSNNIKYLEEIQFSVLLFGVIYPRLRKPETIES